MTRSSRVVYTAITNRHAHLSARPLAPDTDFICYSDVPLDRDDWQIRPVEAASSLPPRMRAKFHKLFPPEGYAWNVWIDGAYVLRLDATRLVDDLIAHSPRGFGLHRHNTRNCLFDEAEHTILLDKYSGQRGIIEAQVRHYEELGHPKSWGLWAGGLMCKCWLTAELSEALCAFGGVRSRMPRRCSIARWTYSTSTDYTRVRPCFRI